LLIENPERPHHAAVFNQQSKINNQQSAISNRA